MVLQLSLYGAHSCSTMSCSRAARSVALFWLWFVVRLHSTLLDCQSTRCVGRVCWLTCACCHTAAAAAVAAAAAAARSWRTSYCYGGCCARRLTLPYWRSTLSPSPHMRWQSRMAETRSKHQCPTSTQVQTSGILRAVILSSDGGCAMQQYTVSQPLKPATSPCLVTITVIRVQALLKIETFARRTHKNNGTFSHQYPFVHMNTSMIHLGRQCCCCAVVCRRGGALHACHPLQHPLD
jgi:hypothetical protein